MTLENLDPSQITALIVAITGFIAEIRRTFVSRRCRRKK